MVCAPFYLPIYLFMQKMPVQLTTSCYQCRIFFPTLCLNELCFLLTGIQLNFPAASRTMMPAAANGPDRIICYWKRTTPYLNTSLWKNEGKRRNKLIQRTSSKPCIEISRALAQIRLHSYSGIEYQNIYFLHFKPTRAL